MTATARECEFRCVTAADVGMPEVGGMVDIDPGCPVHDASPLAPVERS